MFDFLVDLVLEDQHLIFDFGIELFEHVWQRLFAQEVKLGGRGRHLLGQLSELSQLIIGHASTSLCACPATTGSRFLFSVRNDNFNFLRRFLYQIIKFLIALKKLKASILIMFFDIPFIFRHMLLKLILHFIKL